MSQPETPILVVRRRIAASAERLFEAWTTPAQLTAWWGPRGVRCVHADVDARIGGAYRIENALPDGRTLFISGEFLAVEPPRRLVYTWSIEPGSVLTRVIEVKEFVERLPTRVNKILDAIGNNELKIRVDAIDERVVLDGLQKVANRITLGLVLAALIVGAALLMRVETSFRILGYPGLPMIFFLLAAIAGLVLIVSIVFYDKHPRKKSSGN